MVDKIGDKPGNIPGNIPAAKDGQVAKQVEQGKATVPKVDLKTAQEVMNSVNKLTATPKPSVAPIPKPNLSQDDALFDRLMNAKDLNINGLSALLGEVFRGIAKDLMRSAYTNFMETLKHMGELRTLEIEAKKEAAETEFQAAHARAISHIVEGSVSMAGSAAAASLSFAGSLKSNAAFEGEEENISQPSGGKQAKIRDDDIELNDLSSSSRPGTPPPRANPNNDDDVLLEPAPRNQPQPKVKQREPIVEEPGDEPLDNADSESLASSASSAAARANRSAEERANAAQRAGAPYRFASQITEESSKAIGKIEEGATDIGAGTEDLAAKKKRIDAETLESAISTQEGLKQQFMQNYTRQLEMIQQIMNQAQSTQSTTTRGNSEVWTRN